MKNKLVFDDCYNTIFDEIEKHGGKVFIVGGTIRDYLLYGETNQDDIDVEIYGLSMEQLETILHTFGTMNHIGKSFGIIKLKEYPNIDFALPRKEIQSGIGHKGFDIHIDPTLSYQVASKRRDFTINALMYDYRNQEILDFYQGLEHLELGILEMVDETTFQEDPLRVYRLAQFLSRYEFGVSEKTKQTCTKMVKEEVVKSLGKERIEAEYRKLFLGKKPSLGLEFLSKIGVLPSVTKLQYKQIDIAKKDIQFLSCLALDIYRNNYFGFSQKTINYYKQVTHVLGLCKNIDNKRSYYQFLHEIDSNIQIEDILSMLDIQHRLEEKHRIKNYLIKYGFQAKEPIIKGDDLLQLGIIPSKEFGILYERCYQMQLDGYSREELVQYIKEIKR